MSGWLSLLGYYTLPVLKKDIESLKTNDPKPIMKYVEGIEKFESMFRSDKVEAKKVLCGLFWTRKRKSADYQFTPRVRFLSAKDLSMVICNIGDKHIEKYIFEDTNDEILSCYPRTDLIVMLTKHYSDPFALYIFNKFSDYLNWPLTERQSYLNCISTDMMLRVCNSNDIGKRMKGEELIICFHKMTRTQYIQKCAAIVPTVISAICRQNIALFTLSHLYLIYSNDLIPMDIDIKMFTDVLKNKYAATVHGLERNKQTVNRWRTRINSSINSIDTNVNNYNKNENGHCSKLSDIKSELKEKTGSLSEQYQKLIEINRVEVLNSALQTALTIQQKNQRQMHLLQADDAKQKDVISSLKQERAALQKQNEEKDVIVTQLNVEIERLKSELCGAQTLMNDLSHKYAKCNERMQSLETECYKMKDDEKEYELRILQLEKANKILKCKSLEARSYEEWDTEDIVMWIMSLDRDRYTKYEQTLHENLHTEGVLGHDLKDVDSGDIRGWGITDFRDKKYLLQKIQELVMENRNVEDAEGVIKSCNDDQTAYK